MPSGEKIRKELETHFKLALEYKGMDSSIADSLSISSLYLLLELGLVKKVDIELPVWELVIYPKSIEGGDNPYSERSPYQNGWNDAVIKIGKNMAAFEYEVVAVEPLVKEE